MKPIYLIFLLLLPFSVSAQYSPKIDSEEIIEEYTIGETFNEFSHYVEYIGDVNEYKVYEGNLTKPLKYMNCFFEESFYVAVNSNNDIESISLEKSYSGVKHFDYAQAELLRLLNHCMEYFGTRPHKDELDNGATTMLTWYGDKLRYEIMFEAKGSTEGEVLSIILSKKSFMN